MDNILLQKFDTPFESIPFENIKQEEFEPAIKEAISIAEKEVDDIVNNPEAPTFENTLEALEKSGEQLNTISAVLFNLCSAETNDFLEKVQEAVSPLLAKFSNDISLNEALFLKIKQVHDTMDNAELNQEQKRLLNKTYKGFTRNGALLSEENKTKLREIDQSLSVLSVKFAQNVLQETNAFALNITKEEQLEGLPESIKTQAAETAKSREESGWTFTLQYPSYLPFMKFIKNRDLREKMYMANGVKAHQDNEYNNEENIHQIVALRQKRAQLLGFDTHADFILEERMAGDKETVTHFLNDLLSKAKSFGVKDVVDLKPLAEKDGIKEIKPYDHAYYAEKLREEKFDYSEEELKPYFPLNQVLAAAFKAANKLYGFEFKERTDIQKYQEEVEVYEVLENGNHQALLYTDWYPRKGKRPGAWMTEYRGQHKEEKGNYRPQVSIVCNFSRPSGDTPSLLTFQEVTTLFHEFGHALHAINANTMYESLAAPNVYWDFVELPSQFMENYCYQKDFLTSFAKHYKTGEILPEKQIDKIIASSNFMEGYQTLRQLSLGLLDMAYHTGQLKKGESIEHFEDTAMAPTKLYPKIEGTAISPSFSHIFAGGYSAGYYSYKWSEVLDADAFSLFKEKGIFDSETAKKFQTLLRKGGTEDPMDLYIAFRGREPKVEALLERAGLK